jgi:flagellar protein FliO/FliZ
MLQSAPMIVGLAGALLANHAVASESLNVSHTTSQTLLALLIVVALIFALAYFARRIPGLVTRGAGALRTIDVIALSTRDKLVLLEVEGERVLLAVGPQGIQRLHVITRPGTSFSATLDAAQLPAESAP